MPHLILYDSQCGLCNRVVQFVLRKDRTAQFHFCSMDSELGKQFSAPASSERDVAGTVLVVVDYQEKSGPVLARSTAALFIVSQLGWWWKPCGLARLLPLSLRDRMYDWVARNRLRWFQPPLSCPMLSSDQRRRFLD